MQKVACNKQHKRTYLKSNGKRETDRTWLSHLLQCPARKWNSLFLQPRSPHGAIYQQVQLDYFTGTNIYTSIIYTFTYFFISLSFNCICYHGLKWVCCCHVLISNNKPISSHKVLVYFIEHINFGHFKKRRMMVIMSTCINVITNC